MRRKVTSKARKTRLVGTLLYFFGCLFDACKSYCLCEGVDGSSRSADASAHSKSTLTVGAHGTSLTHADPV